MVNQHSTSMVLIVVITFDGDLLCPGIQQANPSMQPYTITTFQISNLLRQEGWRGGAYNSHGREVFFVVF